MGAHEGHGIGKVLRQGHHVPPWPLQLDLAPPRLQLRGDPKRRVFIFLLLEFEVARDGQPFDPPAQVRLGDRRHAFTYPSRRRFGERPRCFSSEHFRALHCHGKPPALPEESRSSTIPGRVRVALSKGKPIPLTLTLSHGEREQPAAGSVVREVRRADTALGCSESQRGILPLPEGEGRGGKGDARCANRVGSSPEICWSHEGPYGFESFILSCLRL